MNLLKNNTSKLPFKVSARTARLIGRENIATAKGAIIELVKNSYDADSNICIVYFDNKYSVILNEISQEYYDKLLQFGISSKILINAYSKNQKIYKLKEDISESEKAELRNNLAKLCTLYIIDTGEGMTQNVIRDQWMTIGTDYKSINVFTKTGRVKAGAKGIGRFALDKLGSKCEMITFFNPKYHQIDTDENQRPTTNKGYKWNVNWEDFEGDFKTIDTVAATLTGISNSSFIEEAKKIFSIDVIKNDLLQKDLKYGTILKITELREYWDDFYVNQVYSDLEVLVPPKETGGFEIHLYSSLKPDKYGEVYGSVCDDFDYKLVAIADENQAVKVKIFRNEYDIDLIPKDFFKREEMNLEPFREKDFKKGYWEKTFTFSQLLKGFKAVDDENVFSNIGVFEFTFYFLKKTFSTPDANRFYYKKFMSNSRREWLDKFGGIKLFRDNFRVRPYGEVRDSAFDWLGLGFRKTTSPAGIAKPEGGYRVEPDNIAGSVKISRLTNVNFEDKSSREGLQDNKTFRVFKLLLTSIINLFEEDRAYIARAMADYEDTIYGPERDRKAAEELAKRIIENTKRKKREAIYNNKLSQQSQNDDENTDKDKELLASEIERQEEEIEKLKEEQKVLRGLASSGIVLASFSHDLSKLKNVLDSRTDKLKEILLEKINLKDYINIEDRKNPFVLIEKIKKQDIKLQNWLNFSLGATRKDKRKRNQLFLKKYFSDLEVDWHTILTNRGIKLTTKEIEDIDIRVFEIDFDSIFNNLLVNSIEAFNLLKQNRKREIRITTKTNNKEIVIDYFDNGPGLSIDIISPEKIFEPLFTTKRNPFTGDEEGTGLGMWLIKSIVKENDGVVKLLYPDIGFGIRLIFPIKYKRNNNV